MKEISISGPVIIFLILYFVFIAPTYNKNKSKIGEEIIFSGDTLMIVHYRFLSKSYILEDGREISIKLINK